MKFFQAIKNFFKPTKGQQAMLNKIIDMYKAGSYNELIMIGQVMNAIMTTFAQEKFKNGESDRDAAIDTLCELLQSHKSNGQNPL